ncbi:MAG: hypothetical protein ACM31C_25005, partial [Acidobacteriota bacterium]
MSVTKYASFAALACVAACAGILGLRRTGPQPFPHRKHVLAGVACTTCHPAMAHDDGVSLHVPGPASCVTAACHPHPHDRSPCLTCHGGELAIAELVEAREHLRFD